MADYDEHGRVQEGDLDQATDAAYQAWQADIADGRASILVADATAAVVDLNRRSRADRILAGFVNPRRAVRLAAGTEASRGDVVITRRNDRRLRTGADGFVRNGDRWQIVRVHRDGAVTARRLHPATRKPGQRPEMVVLPGEYVADHLDLGYAVTAYRAQGVTVDTAHVLV